jgi:ferredoxin
MWNIEVSPACIGAGVCAGTAPDHFALGPDGHSTPRAPTVDPDDAILGAVASCPMEAITVTDDSTGEPIDAFS